MSNYRLDIDSYTGPIDTNRLDYLLSIVSEDDELEITIDKNNPERADEICNILRSNEFEVLTKVKLDDGKQHLIAHRKG